MSLDDARRSFWEDPAGALRVAVECHEEAHEDPVLRARALIVEGCVSLHRGDLRGAFALAAAAEASAGDDPYAGAELAALMTHLTFFSGSYSASLQHAERGVELADRTGDLSLRLFARRMGCLAFGNLGVPDLRERLEDTLRLAVEAGEGWQEALSRNDLGHNLMEHGELEAAEAELERGIALARGTTFGMGVLLCTRGEVRARAGRSEEALADTSRAIELVAADSDPNPYLMGMAVLAKVQTLLALGRVEDARAAGEDAVARLGERVPQARSMLLVTVADALRDAGRFEEAYDALARGAALEREAMREFAEIQVGLERSRLELAAARAEAQRFREQADRDFLTGLHNRRYLSRAEVGGLVSLAIVDLDHFKPINDRFGHHVGDQVLVRVANLLEQHVRGGDTVVRAGGEEFVVLMPQTGAIEAGICCERLRQAIQAEPWDDVAAGLTVTASVGVVSRADCDIDVLTREADRRLYDAKRAGRDRVSA